MADLGARGRRPLVRVDPEAGQRGGAPVREQAQRHRIGQRIDGPDELARHTQGFTAGREHGELGAAGQQVVGEGGGGLDDVLAVVQEQQHAAPGEVFGEPGERFGSAAAFDGPQLLRARTAQHGLAAAERGEDGLRHRLRVIDRCQFRQPDPVRPGGGIDGFGGLLGEPGLARAAGTEQGDEAGVGEVAAQGLDIALPADEAGEPGPEVAGRGDGDSGGRGGWTARGRAAVRGCGALRRSPGYDRQLRFLSEQLRVQGPEFGARIGAEPVGEHGAHLLVRGQRLGSASGVAQGAQPQRLERFVEGVLAAERGQFRQQLLGPAEGE